MQVFHLMVAEVLLALVVPDHQTSLSDYLEAYPEVLQEQ